MIRSASDVHDTDNRQHRDPFDQDQAKSWQYYHIEHVARVPREEIARRAASSRDHALN
jgi:hypothetical protein